MNLFLIKKNGVTTIRINYIMRYLMESLENYLINFLLKRNKILKTLSENEK
jgi:hypothetical protein